MTFFGDMELAGASRLVAVDHRESGLRGFIVIDDTTLGPAAGGVRTRTYESEAAALRDAAGLARAMTVKCALAGLPAGGGKAVLLDHPDLDRRAAFARLGQLVEELRGLFRTAGDLGTTLEDLLVMAEHTQWVHTNEEVLTRGVGRSMVRCIRACTELMERDDLRGLRVAIQGCGAIGTAVARELAEVGAELTLADIDPARAETLGHELGAAVVTSDEILKVETDVLAPCAVGGVVTPDNAPHLRAAALCGAANNILSEPEADRILARRGILHVPDVIASSGAAIEGLGQTLMGLDDRGALIDRLQATAREVLEESRTTGHPAGEVAMARARRIIESGQMS